MYYKHIVFDVDGTLLDTEHAVLCSLQDTIEEASGRRPPQGELAFALGITGEDALRALGFADVPAALDRWVQNLARYSGAVTAFKGVKEMLAALARQGCRLGVVTSKMRSELDEEFMRFGLGRYFSTVVCADDTEEHKPSPGPLLCYMERAGAGRDELLYVGDSRYDSECAGAAGVDFALAAWGCRAPGVRAEHYAATPMGLAALLREKE